GFEFISRIVGGTIPKEYVPAVGKGIQNTLVNGVLAAFPVVDVKVTLVDGSYHDVDSTETAFSIAGSMRLTDGMRKPTPRFRRLSSGGGGGMRALQPHQAVQRQPHPAATADHHREHALAEPAAEHGAGRVRVHVQVLGAHLPHLAAADAAAAGGGDLGHEHLLEAAGDG